MLESIRKLYYNSIWKKIHLIKLKSIIGNEIIESWRVQKYKIMISKNTENNTENNNSHINILNNINILLKNDNEIILKFLSVVSIKPKEIGITSKDILVKSILSILIRFSEYGNPNKYIRKRDEKNNTFLYGYEYFLSLTHKIIDVIKRKATGSPFILLGSNGKRQKR